MSSLFVLLAMIFLHIVDDFYLQKQLADYKQKTWWEKNFPEEMYAFDYIVALIIHSFSWTFMIMLPIAINIHATPWFFVVFVGNLIVHSIVDDLKANKHYINLFLDQSIHLAQIFLTFIILY